MEYRKLIAFGKSSYVISLPKEWIKANNLKKGDTVSINNQTNNLVVSVHEQEPLIKQLLILTDGKSLSRIETELVSAYINNYNRIMLSGDNLKTGARKIKDILHNLPGLEVIEETKNKIVLKEILDEKEVSVKAIIRKIDNITRAMLEDTLLCLKEDHYESIYQRDYEVNRGLYLVNRVGRNIIEKSQLNSHDLTPIDVLVYLDIATNIEKVGDHAKRIARALRQTELTKNQKNQFEDCFKKSKDLYLDSMKCFYKKNIELAHEVVERYDNLIELCFKILKVEENIKMYKLIDYVKHVIVASRNIGRAVLRNS